MIILSWIPPEETISMSKTVLFQTIQFSISTQFSSLRSIDRRYQVLPLRARVDLGVMAMNSQSSDISGTSPSDCLVSYPGESLVGGSYRFAEKQSMYFTAPVDWVIAGCRLLVQFMVRLRYNDIIGSIISLKKLMLRLRNQRNRCLSVPLKTTTPA